MEQKTLRPKAGGITLPRALAFLAASLGLHLLTLFIPSHHEGPAPSPTVVEIHEIPPAATPEKPASDNHQKTGSASKTSPVKAPAAKSSRPSLKALSPSFHPATTTTPDESAVPVAPDAQPFDNPQSYGVQGGNYDAGNAIRGFLEAEYSRINDLLIFDSILAQYDHFGIVYLEFEVDPRGVIRPETIRTKTADKILKVHTLRSAVLPGLAEPVKANLQLAADHEPVKLRVRVEYLHGVQGQTLWDENPDRIAGFALSFRRYTSERAVQRTLGRHLMNGGVSYDPFAMYEAWQKYNKAGERRRLEVDPFGEYKADPYYDR